MRLILPALHLLLICAQIVAGAALADNRSSANLTIGFVVPLSGDWAFLGSGIRDGALLAQKDLKAIGIDTALRFEDGQGSLSTSALATKKLLESEKVDALISIVSGVGSIIKPLATRSKVLHIAIASETDIADGMYNFINYLTAEQGVTKFLEHVGSNKSLGIFALQEAGFQRIVSELRRQAQDTTSILFAESFNQGTTDFRPLLIKRASLKPDLLLILGLSPEIETLVKQARGLGIKTPVASIEGFGLASDKSPFEGAWFVDSATPSAELHARFVQSYGYEPTPGVGHAYDSVMLLARAFDGDHSRSISDRREKAAIAFRRVRGYPGTVGHLKVRPDGVIWSDAVVRVIKQGKIE